MRMLCIILLIEIIVSMIWISELTNQLEDAKERISMLEFEKRQEYMRGVREGIDMGKGYSERFTDNHA